MTQNVNLLTLVFDGMNNYKKMNWPKNQVKIQTKLKKAPDFYVEMHWECNSAIIPFLQKIAPSDKIQIWKKGDNVRMDFSLVGFQSFKNKRR